MGEGEERQQRRTRRGFLKGLATVAAGGAALGAIGALGSLARADEGAGAKASAAPIPKRALGKTGVEVTIVGLGGWHIGTQSDAKDGIALVARAVDEGVTFLDNAAEYHGGESERRMGEALAAGGRRDKVFLMSKCCDHERTREGSLRALEDQLRRLRTDRLDLWQLHDIGQRADDPARIFAKGGALEAIEAAKKAGKVRFVGFTGHRDPAIHKAMLAPGFAWDAVQMPVNPADPHFKSFERDVLPILRERGIAAIAMKALAAGTLARSGVVTAEECRRYALSVPGVATLVCGIDDGARLAQDLAIARGFMAMDEAGRTALVARCEGLAKDPRIEGYKRDG